MESIDLVITKLDDELQPFFSRADISKALGGILKARTLKNMDTQGKGPSVRMKIGNKIAYEKTSFIEWFKKYIKN
jgi:hypothetical protein